MLRTETTYEDGTLFLRNTYPCKTDEDMDVFDEVIDDLYESEVETWYVLCGPEDADVIVWFDLQELLPPSFHRQNSPCQIC